MISAPPSSSSSRSRGSNKSSSAASNESEKRSKEIRNFQAAVPENKSCFDCGQRGPTYVNMTIGSFVCTKCSGTLRGINPPHRIKSLSMSSFTAEEVSFLRTRGNIWAKKVYTGLYDHSRTSFDVKDDEGIKDFIIEKYEKMRYYVDPSTISHSPPVSPTSSGVGSSSSKKTSSDISSGLIGSTLNAKLNNGNKSSTATSVSLSRPPAKETVHTNVSRPTTTSQILPDLSSNDPFGGKSSASSTKNNQSTFESFANFDAANFDSQPTSQVNSVAQIQRTAKSGILASTKPQPVSEANKFEAKQDRYAALKDLDDIFRSSVTIQDNSSATTGANLFGTSPVQAVPISGLQQSQSNQWSPKPSEDVAHTMWPQTAGNVSQWPSNNMQWPSGSSNARSDNSATTPWPQQNNQWPITGSGSSGANSDWAKWEDKNGSNSNGATSSPINPFTGTSNLSQLNTSPWPTTGNSPVNTGLNPQSQPQHKFFGGQQLPKSSDRQNSSASTFPDPFDTSNVQSEKTNDLFANAPKPFSSEASVLQMNNHSLGSDNKIQKTSTGGTDVKKFETFFEDLVGNAAKKSAEKENTLVDNGNPWQQTHPNLSSKSNKNPFL